MKSLAFALSIFLMFAGFFYCLSNDPTSDTWIESPPLNFETIDGALISTNDYNESYPQLINHDGVLYLYYLSDNPGLPGHQGGVDLYRVRYIPESGLFDSTIENLNTIIPEINDELSITSYHVMETDGLKIVFNKDLDGVRNLFLASDFGIVPYIDQGSTGYTGKVIQILLYEDPFMGILVVDEGQALVYLINTEEEDSIMVKPITEINALFSPTNLFSIKQVPIPNQGGKYGLLVHLLENAKPRFVWVNPASQIISLRFPHLPDQPGGMNISDDGKVYFHALGPFDNFDLYRYNQPLFNANIYSAGEGNIIPQIPLPTLATPIPTPPTPTPTPTPTPGVWSKIVDSPSIGYMNGVAITDMETGWAVGDYEGYTELWQLTATGWEATVGPDDYSILRDIDMVDSQTGFAVGDIGALWVLERGTWSLGPTPIEYSMYAVDAIDGNNAWAVGDNGALWKLDPASGWLDHTSPGNHYMTSLALVDAQNGWAGSSGNDMWKLENGTWSHLVITGEALNDLDIVDMNSGWAVGYGELWKLEDGNWNLVTSPSGDSMRTIQLIDANNGWALGDSGAIWKLEDGTWTALAGPDPMDNMSDMDLVAINYGWAVGESGALWKLSPP